MTAFRASLLFAWVPSGPPQFLFLSEALDFMFLQASKGRQKRNGKV
jgi:hypothetical protein